jgi:hypothetical protein
MIKRSLFFLLGTHFELRLSRSRFSASSLFTFTLGDGDYLVLLSLCCQISRSNARPSSLRGVALHDK